MKRLFYLFFPLLCSCTINNSGVFYKTITYDSFKNRESLTSSVISLDSMDYGFTFSVIDSICYLDNARAEHLLSVYNLNTGKKITSFIRLGRANNELPGSALSTVCEEEGVVLIAERAGQKCLVYSYDDIRSIQSNSMVKPISTFLLPVFFSRITPINNGNFVGLPVGDPTFKDRLCFLNNTGNTLFFAGNCPKTSEMKFPDDRNYIAFNANLVANTKKEQIYVFNTETDLIEIYNFNGDLLCMIKGPVGFDPELNKEQDERRSAYFSPVAKGEDIWVIYLGEPQHSRSMSKVLRFDSDGTPKTIYELDRSVIHIDVDPHTNTLYATSLNEETGEIDLLKFKYNV